jgi:hypothetical protein
MIRKALWLLLLLGYVAMVWHGATGDTGPMGWLNALQQHWTGGYSRKLSFIVFCFGTIALTSPILLPLILASPPKPPATTAQGAPAEPASAWKTAVLTWGVPIALAWAATFGWHAWEWHVRGQDIAQPYEPVDLAASATAAPVSRGSHLALQGRFLWDRTVVRRERGKTETTYVPVVALAWREGEPVRFIAQFESSEMPARRGSDPTRHDAILARVDGSVPTAAFDAFANAGAKLAPSAALVVPVAASDGRPVKKQAAFDLENALLISTVLTVIWTVCMLAIALAHVRQVWSERRRARSAAQYVAESPRSHWKWIGIGFHRK